MSRIDELIAKHCPEGVQNQPLRTIARIRTGEAVSKKAIASNPGEFPVINSGREALGYIDRFNTEDDPLGITSRGAGVGSVTWCEGRYFRGNLNYSVTVLNPQAVETRYLYHLLLQQQNAIQALCTFQGIPALNKANLEKLMIPVPPLEVQRAIVEILDTFSKLEAELEAELEARKQQYEHYREHLLQHTSSSEILSLGDLVRIRNGKDHKHLAEGEIPVYGSGGVMRYVDTPSAQGPSVLIPRKGSLGNIFYVEGPFWNVDTIFSTEIDTSLVEPKFLFHKISTMGLGEMNQAGGVPSQTQTVLNGLKLSVPPLNEQREIVSILDKFDALVNGLSIGLPAELAARRQQYEYYRDKLLTFKELEVAS